MQERPTQAPLREMLLEALDTFGYPTGHEELAAYTWVVHGRAVSSEDLRALLRDEERRYRTGEQRKVWISPAIVECTPGEPGFFPDARLLTRSDWPLDHRVLIPSSKVVYEVVLTRQLCRVVSIALEEGRSLSDVEPLRRLAAKRIELLLPEGIVEARIRLEESTDEMTEVMAVREWLIVAGYVAEDAAEVLFQADQVPRQRFAEALAQMSPEVQLFGVPFDLDGDAADAR